MSMQRASAFSSSVNASVFVAFEKWVEAEESRYKEPKPNN